MLTPLDMKSWKGRPAWCGPSAVSALAGIPLDKAHSLFAFATNQKIGDVSGVHPDEMMRVLHELGLKARRVDLPTRYSNNRCGVTLRRYLQERPSEERMYPLLIEVEGHFLTAHMDWLIDNSHPKPTPVEKFSKKGRLVKNVWIVTRW